MLEKVCVVFLVRAQVHGFLFERRGLIPELVSTISSAFLFSQTHLAAEARAGS